MYGGAYYQVTYFIHFLAVKSVRDFSYSGNFKIESPSSTGVPVLRVQLSSDFTVMSGPFRFLIYGLGQM